MRFFVLLACLCTALSLVSAPAAASTDVVQSWDQILGEQYPQTFTVDSKGSVYIASYMVLDGKDDWYIYKFNSLGQYQWSRTILTSNVPAAMTVDADGNLYLTSTVATFPVASVFTVKLLSNGEVAWTNSYAGGSGLAINADSDGNVFVAGSTTYDTGLILLEYNSAGDMVNSVQRKDIAPVSEFFMPNGNLVANGFAPGTNNPIVDVLSNTGSYLFGRTTDSSSTDTYKYSASCDATNNLYLTVNHNVTSSNANSFTVDSFGPTGVDIWQTGAVDGIAQQISASDPNHAYVQASNNGSYSNMGFGANGARFLSAPGQQGLIAADGTRGLVTVAGNNYGTFSYSEINGSAQTLWTETYLPGKAMGTTGLKVINSTVYSLNYVLDGELGMNFVKFVQGAAITAVTPAAASIQGGKSLNVTVQLNDVAPAGGLPVYFVSSLPALGLPASAVIPAGKSTLTVSAITHPVDVATSVTISAKVNGGIRNTTVVLNPAVLSTFAFPGGASATVVGGQTVTGTIQLSGPTGQLPHVVTLSVDSAKAAVPATINVLPGTSSATFVVHTTAVTASTLVGVTAKYAGLSITARLTITP